MKMACLTALFACFMIPASGQQVDGQHQDFLKEIFARAASHPAVGMPVINSPRTDLKIPASLLLETASFQQAIKPGAANQQPRTTKAKRPSGGLKPTATCKDTSYRRLIGVHNAYVFIQSVTQSLDGGIFLSAMMND